MADITELQSGILGSDCISEGLRAVDRSWLATLELWWEERWMNMAERMILRINFDSAYHYWYWESCCITFIGHLLLLKHFTFLQHTCVLPVRWTISKRKIVTHIFYFHSTFFKKKLKLWLKKNKKFTILTVFKCTVH